MLVLCNFKVKYTHHEEILYDALFPNDMRKLVYWIRYHCRMKATSCGRVSYYFLGLLYHLNHVSRFDLTNYSDRKLPVVKR